MSIDWGSDEQCLKTLYIATFCAMDIINRKKVWKKKKERSKHLIFLTVTQT